jgi:hypothetical protein
MILPPKRWERDSLAKYDPIRHRPWFRLLCKRKHSLHHMAYAYSFMKENDTSQKEACSQFSLSEREFQDYIEFVEGESRHSKLDGKKKQVFLEILNDAYRIYTHNLASKNIVFYIRQVAPLWGVNPRHVTEMWEVDPKFYPTGYAEL